MQTGWGKLVRGRLGLTRGDLFTPQQCAEILGFSAATARAIIRKGLLPATDVHGGYGAPLWRSTREDILAYVDAIERKA